MAGLRRVLEAIGAVYDYAEPADAPFTATITIHNTAALWLDDLADVRVQLERVKRASVHLTLQASAGFCVRHGAGRRRGGPGVRLYNVTDDAPVTGSWFVVTATTPTLLTSRSGFSVVLST